jgi:2-dehydropantoate 2-reductase
MNLLVFGAGAIGAYIGVNLIRAGNAVTFVGRAVFFEAATRSGITIHLPTGNTWDFKPIYAYPDLDAARRRGPFDATLLTLKSHAVATALPDLGNHADVLGKIVCFQNGVATEDEVAAVFGRDRVIAATLTSPVSQREPAEFALDALKGGVGYGAVGNDAGYAQKLASASLTDFMPARVYPNARAMKWSKMLLNIVANASSALFGKSAGEIYADSGLFALERAMLRECLAVMRAEGIPVIDLPGYRARQLAFVIEHLPAALAQSLLKTRVARGRGAKWPSFYYDVRNQSGRSEVGALNGQIVAYGAKHGIPTPVNAWLTDMLLRAVRGEVDLAALTRPRIT